MILMSILIRRIIFLSNNKKNKRREESEILVMMNVSFLTIKKLSGKYVIQVDFS